MNMETMVAAYVVQDRIRGYGENMGRVSGIEDFPQVRKDDVIEKLMISGPKTEDVKSKHAADILRYIIFIIGQRMERSE